MCQQIEHSISRSLVKLFLFRHAQRLPLKEKTNHFTYTHDIFLKFERSKFKKFEIFSLALTTDLNFETIYDGGNGYYRERVSGTYITINITVLNSEGATLVLKFESWNFSESWGQIWILVTRSVSKIDNKEQLQFVSTAPLPHEKFLQRYCH